MDWLASASDTVKTCFWIGLLFAVGLVSIIVQIVREKHQQDRKRRLAEPETVPERPRSVFSVQRAALEAHEDTERRRPIAASAPLAPDSYLRTISMARPPLSQRPNFTKYKTFTVSTVQPKIPIPSRISGTQSEVAALYNTLATAPQVPGRQLGLQPGAYGIYDGHLQKGPEAPLVAANWGWEITQVGGSGREPDITYSLFLEEGSHAADNWLDMIFGACFDITSGVGDELATPKGPLNCIKVSRRASHFGGLNRVMWFEATKLILVRLAVDPPPVSGPRWAPFNCMLRESTEVPIFGD